MLGMIGKILCIVGLMILFLLFFVIFLLLLVLFFPVSYELRGQKDPGIGKKESPSDRQETADLQMDQGACGDKPDWQVDVKVKWLFGLLKAVFAYPNPGTLIVKVSGIKVFDSGAPKASSDTGAADKKDVSDKKVTVKSDKKIEIPESSAVAADQENVSKTAETSTDNAGNHNREASDATGKGKIRKISDKIKEIYVLTDYYLSVLKEDDTGQLFSHVLTRLVRILKSIRPRKIEGKLLIGTGSPDTTGYVMALYGILSTQLGQNLTVTPDFEEKKLEGNLYIKGRITIGVLAFHGIKVLLDRRLRKFIKKLKGRSK